jgi:hypothetical protein
MEKCLRNCSKFWSVCSCESSKAENSTQRFGVCVCEWERETERERTNQASQRFNGVIERMIWNTRSCTERFNVVCERERERERENNLRYYAREIQWCKRENNRNNAFKAGYWKPRRDWVWERERRIKTQMQLRNQSIRESSILKASQNSSESRNLSFHNPKN